MRPQHLFFIYLLFFFVVSAAHADDRDSSLSFPSEYRYSIIEPAGGGGERIRVPEGDFLIGQPGDAKRILPFPSAEQPAEIPMVKAAPRLMKIKRHDGSTLQREINLEDMVLVPEGEAVIGLPDSLAGSDRNPLRRAAFKAFLIDKYEITNAQYKRCVAAGGCTVPSLIIDYPWTFHEAGKDWYKDASRDDYPVVGLTWKQSNEYCRWAGKRLPTAAEWEKAARGTDGRTYPWGNDWDASRANWDDEGRTDSFEKIAPVGCFPQGASPYGAEDMAGNVREWVDDLVLKGGSWYSYPENLRSGDPGHEYIVERDDDMGFRCIKYVSH